MLQDVIDAANELDSRQGEKTFPPPTKFSIEKINEHFGMQLPASLIQVVRCWRNSGGWLAGLGPDYESPEHIIRTNSYWRNRRPKRRIPRNLVIFNRGFDDDCDCLDLDRFDPATGEYGIRYWTPGISSESPLIFATFEEYMRATIKGWSQTKSRH